MMTPAKADAPPSPKEDGKLRCKFGGFCYIIGSGALKASCSKCGNQGVAILAKKVKLGGAAQKKKSVKKLKPKYRHGK